MIRVLVLLILLTGCSNKQVQVLPTPIGELKALDNFWKLLGDKKEDNKDE